jgi:hypothetical protein
LLLTESCHPLRVHGGTWTVWNWNVSYAESHFGSAGVVIAAIVIARLCAGSLVTNASESEREKNIAHLLRRFTIIAIVKNAIAKGNAMDQRMHFKKT